MINSAEVREILDGIITPSAQADAVEHYELGGFNPGVTAAERAEFKRWVTANALTELAKLDNAEIVGSVEP